MRAILNCLAVALLLSGVSLAAHAHALLDKAEPAVGSEVSPGPTQLRLYFTEGVEAHFSGVSIVGADGKAVVPATAATDPANPAILVVTLPAALAPGDYKVSWHVVSVDTHKTQGTYNFTVKP
jgi:methionine-rich copper-binding protein CopC